MIHLRLNNNSQLNQPWPTVCLEVSANINDVSFEIIIFEINYIMMILSNFVTMMIIDG